MTTTHKILVVFVIALGAFSLGRSCGTDAAAPVHERAASTATSSAPAADTIWTCPMHPQIRLPDFGACPICGMDLVPMEPGGGDDPRRMTMSPSAVALAEIETTRVRRANVTRPVRMVGKVAYDETLVRTISARVAGRLDRLYVDYTGVPVAAGDHLVRLYSPELLTAQEELLSAKERMSATAGEGSAFLAESNRRAYGAAREKLLLWGLSEAQVDAVEARGTADDHVMIPSPTSGVVIEKRLDEGAYVQVGSPIYRIADLREVWVKLDAYEQDLAWLRLGQPVVIEVAALPGETFDGTVAYIDPFLDDRTRTAKVRVNVANDAGRLKPGMFARAAVMARIGAGGAVLGRELAGKWVSPMHPEIVKDGPGACDVCGMDLVPAEDLGLVDAVPGDAPKPLVVPTTAVLVTGERGVVYVEVEGAERPTFEGREVVLGPRAGDEWIVREGLEEGERVVTRGAFRIDSAMQIQAKPSMMSMPGEARRPSGPAATAFRRTTTPLFESYLALQEALAADDEAAARAALERHAAAWSEADAAGLGTTWRARWREERAAAEAAIERARRSDDVVGLRAAFEPLSSAVLSVAGDFGHVASGDGDANALVEAHCPMAFDDRGASWLQRDGAIANPYFGASMLRCGEVRARFAPVADVAAEEPAHGVHRHGAGEHGDHDDDSHDHGDHEHGADEPEAITPEVNPEESERDAAVVDETVERSADAVADETAARAALVTAYLGWQKALADDELAGARIASAVLATATAPQETLSDTFAARAAAIAAVVGTLPAEPSMETMRTALKPITAEVIALVDGGGNPLDEAVLVTHCPMAFDDTGADWLQREGPVHNPYFGARMLRCGYVKRTIAAGGE